MKKIFYSLLTTLCILCGCTTATEHSSITFGVRSDVMNFGYLNEETGKYYGLEIDIANELASRLGYKNVDFKSVLPENRKEMLLNGEVDALIAIYSVSATREENFDFSTPYYTDASYIMVEDSTLFDSILDLKNKNVGILNGSNTGPEFAVKMNEIRMIGDNVIENTDEYTQYEGMRVLKYDSYDALSEALELGEIDAACLDGSIAQTYMDEERSFLDLVVHEQQYAVATQKDSELSISINEKINEMLEDGTISKLIEKWN